VTMLIAGAGKQLVMALVFCLNATGLFGLPLFISSESISLLYLQEPGWLSQYTD